MQAEGRIEGGQARSLVGFYLAAVGVQRFFATLAELADAAFLDSRVILAHLGLQAEPRRPLPLRPGAVRGDRGPVPARADQGAARAAIPVALGGHSLVSGGLMALVEHAWQEHDRRLCRRKRDVDARAGWTNWGHIEERCLQAGTTATGRQERRRVAPCLFV